MLMLMLMPMPMLLLGEAVKPSGQQRSTQWNQRS